MGAMKRDRSMQDLQDELTRLQKELELLESPDTICSFGEMAFDGDGVEQNFVEAAAWFKIAAEQGLARAQHNFALMYENGQGVDHDSSEAAKWYRMAADQGHSGSQNNLGTLYETGDGVPMDKRAALELYRQAADGGDDNAVDNAQRLECLLGKTMTFSEAEGIIDIVERALHQPARDASGRSCLNLKGIDLLRIIQALKIRIANEYLQLVHLNSFEERFDEGLNLYNSIPFSILNLNSESQDEYLDKTTLKLDPRLGSSEDCRSFGEFCNQIGWEDDDYWKLVYERIGLEYDSRSPVANLPQHVNERR